MEEEKCKESIQMECMIVEKQACTTVTEPVKLNSLYFCDMSPVKVCKIETDTSCEEVEDNECSLVQDVLCRNVTQTR